MLNKTTIIILAAGKGTRMKSDQAKVLHLLSGRTMISYVVHSAVEVAGNQVIVVVGTQAEKVKSEIQKASKVRFALQQDQMGTGHAVKCALPTISSDTDEVVILSGDVPLIQPATIRSLIDQHRADGNQLTLMALDLEDPFGYGRLIIDKNGCVERIAEEVDAIDAERDIRLVNAGVYCVQKPFLQSAIMKLKTDNRQHEMYLTDIVKIASEEQHKTGWMLCENPCELVGINTCQDLLKVEALLKEMPKKS